MIDLTSFIPLLFFVAGCITGWFFTFLHHEYNSDYNKMMRQRVKEGNYSICTMYNWLKRRTRKDRTDE